MSIPRWVAVLSIVTYVLGAPMPTESISATIDDDMAPTPTDYLSAEMATMSLTPLVVTSTMVDPSNSMQIIYPSGTPASPDDGGTQAAGDRANDASLEYSVFFPADFDFVNGGKLPGLYGGGQKCAVEDTGPDCFSTRMKWGEDGHGELYFYAPKHKKTSSLCSGPASCSIDSGGWTFPRGGWTTIRHDVTLNTPGRNDGGVNIWINGSLVIAHHDVHYLDSPNTCIRTDQASSASGTVLSAESVSQAGIGPCLNGPAAVTVTIPPGTVTLSPGTVTLPPGTVTLAPATVTAPPATITIPPGTVTLQPITVHTTDVITNPVTVIVTDPVTITAAVTDPATDPVDDAMYTFPTLSASEPGLKRWFGHSPRTEQEREQKRYDNGMWKGIHGYPGDPGYTGEPGNAAPPAPTVTVTVTATATVTKMITPAPAPPKAPPPAKKPAPAKPPAKKPAAH